jgi:hypothetical protein
MHAETSFPSSAIRADRRLLRVAAPGAFAFEPLVEIPGPDGATVHAEMPFGDGARDD